MWVQDAAAENHTQKRTQPAMKSFSTLRLISPSGIGKFLASLFIPALWETWRQKLTAIIFSRGKPLSFSCKNTASLGTLQVLSS